MSWQCVLGYNASGLIGTNNPVSIFCSLVGISLSTSKMFQRKCTVSWFIFSRVDSYNQEIYETWKLLSSSIWHLAILFHIRPKSDAYSEAEGFKSSHSYWMPDVMRANDHKPSAQTNELSQYPSYTLIYYITDVHHAGVCPLVIVGLLPNEQRMSVLHFAVKRHPSFTEPLKSKERLIIHCGFRRFSCNPIFSDHSNGDKHKVDDLSLRDSDLTGLLSSFVQLYP